MWKFISRKSAKPELRATLRETFLEAFSTIIKNPYNASCKFQFPKMDASMLTVPGAKHYDKYMFLTLKFTWVASLSFLKDDQCNFHLIKDENRMKFATIFSVSCDLSQKAST